MVDGNLQNYDVSRDGEVFVLVKPPPMNDRGVVMLLNGFDTCRRAHGERGSVSNASTAQGDTAPVAA